MAARRSGGRGLPLGAGKLHFTPPHPLHSIREEPALAPPRRRGGRGVPLGAENLLFTPPHPLHSIREEPAPRLSRQGPTHASFTLAAGRSPSRVARGPRGQIGRAH